MAKNAKRLPVSSIVCPHCGGASAGSFTTVVEQDEAGPTKILHKCNTCGKFYTAEKVVSWQVKKG